MLPNPLRRRWQPLLLMMVCIAGMCVAAMEKWRQDDAYRFWAAVGLSRVLNPVMNATNRGLVVVRQLGRLRTLEQENQQLRHELAENRLLMQLTEEELRRLQRISGLGRWSGPAELRFMTADVIGLITNEESAEMIVNRGSADGVRPRDPAVALGGLIGQVQSVTAHTAHIQGLADPVSAVGAVALKSRSRGILYGRGRGKPMEFIPENEVQPLEIGTLLVTSGFENSVYPKGIVIGKITGRQANMYGMPYGAVQPVVPFESIEEVLLVLPRHRFDGRATTTETLGRYAIEMPLGPQVTSDSLATTGTVLTSGTLTQMRLSTATLTTTSATLEHHSQTTNTTTTQQGKGLRRTPKPVENTDDAAEATPQRDAVQREDMDAPTAAAAEEAKP